MLCCGRARDNTCKMLASTFGVVVLSDQGPDVQSLEVTESKGDLSVPPVKLPEILP